MLQRPVTVRRGDQVMIVLELPGATVSAAGQALKEGRTGERISVRNLTSKTVVHGTVVNSTTVRVAR
jgi:flagella basal body P-ring formation protein FlgA